MSRARIVMSIALAALVAAAPLIAAPQTQQTRDTRSQPTAPAITGTGALGGNVTNDDGSRPVRNAYVVLIGTGKGIVKVTSTDNDGKFMFTALPADRYTVGVSKAPYLGTVAGARRPARTGTPIALADAQKLTNVSIRMPMGAAISGVVSDEKGEPARNAQLALQQWRMQGGERALVAAGNTSSDELGRYRFFGLQPGEYIVAGMRSGAPTVGRVLSTAEVDAALRGGASATAPAAPLSPNAPVRFAPTYFPGTARVADAATITVAVGEERSNVNFRTELIQTARVGGTVMADGQPVATGAVILSSISASVYQTVNSTRVIDGQFTFQGIMPGTYVVTMTGTGALIGQYGLATVEVAGADVFGVQVSMRPLLSFPASLVFRGASIAPAIAGRRVPMKNLGPSASGARPPAVTATDANGAFTASSMLPGSYAIGGPLGFGPSTDTMTWALESVVVDGKDMTDLPLAITADTLPKSVVVTYSDRYQELTGRITRQGGAAVSEYTIIVFPEDKAYWMQGSRRIVITRPGTDGRFTLSGAGPTTLPPGKYLLAAVTDLDRDEQFDPGFLTALIPAAVPVTLQAGEKKVQDLVIR